MGDGQINLDVARSGGHRADVAPGDDRSGKSGFGPVEVELIARLAVGQRDGLGFPVAAAGKDAHALGNADVHLGGEPVGEVARHRKPAGRVEQVGDRLLDRGQLQALNGAVFIAGNHTLVHEGPVVDRSFHKGRQRRNADGAVGGALAGEQLAGFVGDFGDLERGMEAEADQLKGLRCSEGDGGRSGNVVGGRVQFGVDHVAGDVKRGTLRPLCMRRPGANQAD